MFRHSWAFALFDNKYPAERLDEVPGVVRIHLSGHVDLWAAKEEEDDDAENEAGRREYNQPDGANRCQLESRHDETATETTQGASQRPRHRCNNQYTVLYYSGKKTMMMKHWCCWWWWLEYLENEVKWPRQLALTGITVNVTNNQLEQRINTKNAHKLLRDNHGNQSYMN